MYHYLYQHLTNKHVQLYLLTLLYFTLLTCLLTPWSRVLLGKRTGSQLVKKLPAFGGTRRFITMFLRVTCPCPQPDQSSPCPPSPSLIIHLNIILLSMPGSSMWFLSLRFPHQNPVCNTTLPHSATCLAHLILYLITRTIFGG